MTFRKFLGWFLFAFIIFMIAYKPDIAAKMALGLGAAFLKFATGFLEVIERIGSAG